MSVHQELFARNRATKDAVALDRIVALETQWLAAELAELPHPNDGGGGIRAAIEATITLDLEESGEDLAYLAAEMTRAGIRKLVATMAVDGLTEAQSFFSILPRLPLAAQMPVFRVIIDEFGCGQLERAHSHLFARLLAELGLSTELGAHVPCATDECLAFVNVFHWMSERAPVECFLGALAYLEASIPRFFDPFAKACGRLGIASAAYFEEHVHIDVFHAREMSRAIEILKRERGEDAFDEASVRLGVALASKLSGRYFAGAIAAGRTAA